MRATRLVAVVAVAGLVLVIGLVQKSISWREISVPAQPRGEAATNDFYAAQRLIEQLGAHAERRRSLGELPPGNAVIVLSDWNWSVIESRRRQLERWVESGGRLVIDAGLVGGEQELESWSGLALRLKSDDEESDEPEESDETTRSSVLQRLRGLPGECTEIAAVLPRPGVRNLYSLCKGLTDAWLKSSWLTSEQVPAWALQDEEKMQVARVNIGRGSVTLLAAEPFGNRELFWGDHALLFTASTQLRRDDWVYFVSEERATSLLELIWQRGAPVVVLALLLVALWLWRGGTRFGPLLAVYDNAQRSLAAQIRGTARFAVRVGAGGALHAATLRALHEAAGKHIAMYGNLDGQARAAAIARITHIDATALQHALDPHLERDGTGLRTAIGLLETARRKLMGSR